MTTSKFFTPYLPFCIFLAFLSGIIAGYLLPSFGIFVIIAAGVLGLIFLFARARNLLFLDGSLLLLFVCLGALWVIPASYYKLSDFTHRRMAFKLKVTSLPKEYQQRNSFTALITDCERIPLSHKVRVIDYTKKMDYLARYRVSAKLSKRWFKGRDFYTLWVKKDTDLGKLPPTFWDRIAQRTSNYLLALFNDNLTVQGSRFMAAVFLGRRELLGLEKEIITNAGLAHLLAISGLHIGLTSLILFFLLRMFNVKFKSALWVSLIFLYFYTFLTGASPSTLRAAIMFSVFALGFFVKRKVSSLNSLALAGMIILLSSPLVILTIGFQLSFLSVLAIILAYRIYRIKPSRLAVVNYSKQIFFSSAAVVLFISPVVSYYFGKIYPLSIVYNVILNPFFTLILVTNFLLLVFSPFAAAAQLIGPVLSLLIALFIKLSALLVEALPSSLDYTFSPPSIIGYYLILALIIKVSKWGRVHFSAEK